MDQTSIINQIRTDFPFPNTCPNVKENLHGWFGEGNKRLILRYIRGTTKIIFEFGAWLGLSTKFILDATPKDCIVISVDHWEGGATIKNSQKYDEMIKSSYDTFIKNMWDYRDRLIAVRMDGNEAMHYLHKKGLQPDLIYLDMDHEYTPVKKDLGILTNYYPKTVIVGDDMKYHAGVDEAVNEVGKKLKDYILEVDVNSYALVPPNAVKQEYQLRYKYKDPEPVDPDVRLLIVVPLTNYTDQQVTKFKTIMDKKLASLNNYKIYFVGADRLIDDGKYKDKYNIGKLVNISIKKAQRKNYNTIIIHNVNLIPDDELIKYYKYKPKRPIIIGAASDKFMSYLFQFGIISFQLGDLIRLNGYPNTFWNLPPDRDVVNRMVLCDMKVWLPTKGKVIGSTTTINDRNENEVKKLCRQTWKTWRVDGYNSITIARSNKDNEVHLFKLDEYKILFYPIDPVVVKLHHETKKVSTSLVSNFKVSKVPTVRLDMFPEDAISLRDRIMKIYKSSSILSDLYLLKNNSKLKNTIFIYEILQRIYRRHYKSIAIYTRVSDKNDQNILHENKDAINYLHNFFQDVTSLDYSMTDLKGSVDVIISLHYFAVPVFNISNSPLILEERTLFSRFRFLLFSLKHLKKGGSYHDMFLIPISPVAIQLIFIIHKYFKNVTFCKFPYAQSYSSPIHVMATDFIGISNDDIIILEQLVQKWINIQPNPLSLTYHEELYMDHVPNISNSMFIASIISVPTAQYQSIINVINIFKKMYYKELRKKVSNLELTFFIYKFQKKKIVKKIESEKTKYQEKLIDSMNNFIVVTR